MDVGTAKKLIEKNLSYDEVKRLTVKLVQHASPQTPLLEAEPQARIVTREPDYIYVEFTSRLFRFVDDVEFLFDDTAGVIHFRSASRAGRSDLGANRRRMESIRAAFQASGA